MRILITGVDGFIGKNLKLHLRERGDIEVVSFVRSNSVEDLPGLLEGIDFIFHLAGVNRPENPQEFTTGNLELTRCLCDTVRSSGRQISIVYTSSIQASVNNDYGKSKIGAEDVLLQLHRETGNPVFIYRLPNVFGKWARPNYNSAVATFCHNVAHDLPIKIYDPAAVIRLVYVDDVVESFLNRLNSGSSCAEFIEVEPEYQITVGDLAEQLKRFKASRDNLVTEAVGGGLVRALYSTYVSYLPPNKFIYPVQQHGDARGVFVEMLKTSDSGQFSFFTAHPGFTRGGHYHHSKIEKFLVIKGQACFRFRHMQTGEFYEVYTSGGKSEVVETVPGWTHDVTNVGDDELICMLWANEIFDREKPDTYTCPVVSEC